MKRIALTVPDSTHKGLKVWALSEGRSLSNLCSFLVEAALREREKIAMIESAEDRDHG